MKFYYVIKNKMQIKRLLRTFILICLVTGWVWAFNMYSNYQKEETEQQYVQRIHDFYIDSWYNKISEYQSDIENLQEYKQKALDSLSYKQTIEYISIQNKQQSWQIDNEWLNYIDETLQLANEGRMKVDKPEYLSIDSKIVVKEKEPTASELLEQGLLNGMTEAKKSPVKQILK